MMKIFLVKHIYLKKTNKQTKKKVTPLGIQKMSEFNGRWWLPEESSGFNFVMLSERFADFILLSVILRFVQQLFPAN